MAVKKTAIGVPEKHQKRIAIDTLKMSDAGANIMGGMTKEEAREFLKGIGYSDDRIKKLEASKKTAMAKEEVREVGHNAGMQAADSVAEDDPSLTQNREAWTEAATAAEEEHRKYSPLEFMTGAEELGDELMDAYEEGVSDGIYHIVYGKQKPIAASKKENAMASEKKAAIEVDLAQVYKPGLADEAVKLIKSFNLEDLSDEPGRYSIMVDTLAGGALGIHQPAQVAGLFGIKDELLKEIAEHLKDDPDSLQRITGTPVVYDEEAGVFTEGEGGEEIPNDSIIDDWEFSWESIEEVANKLADQLDSAEPLPEPYDDGAWYFGHNENDGSYGLFYSWEMEEGQQTELEI